MSHADGFHNGGGSPSDGVLPPTQNSLPGPLPAAAIYSPGTERGGGPGAVVVLTESPTAPASSLDLLLAKTSEIKLWVGLCEFDDEHKTAGKPYSWPELELYAGYCRELRRRGANPEQYERHLRVYEAAKRLERL